ncbi:endonuclease, partial [Stutzerimonas kirkiae]
MPRPRSIAPAELYEYPAHLRDTVSAMPGGPGVYLLFGAAGAPLYIGKSVNLRARLLSHLRTPEEARLLRQTRSIEVRPTAGEVGALLLESRLIKELQPLYNKRLRKSRRLSSIALCEEGIDIVDTTAAAATRPLYGLFRSRRAATESLCELADEHGLCLALLGLERPSGRACFRHQIGKCRGACVGHESPGEHRQRLSEALANWKVEHWPHPAAIALYERHDELEAFHVINQWHYLGSFPSLAAAREAPS